MKKVLIISPYFPPVNAADMQRIRTSLPYFAKLGWQPTVVTVDERYADMDKDDLLLQSIPTKLNIIKVKAFSKKWTAKLGLGSIALRSLWFYRQTVDQLLSREPFDLIYFSTTQYPVSVLGPHWKHKFNIPYVIDIQDPWHSEYYQGKPKDQRPRKYWFSYRLNKYLEPIALKQVDGLISVSKHYIDTLQQRYPELKNVPAATITFGAFGLDIDIANTNKNKFVPLLKPGDINIVYIGRGGKDMYKALIPVFAALKRGLTDRPELFSRLKLYFIGTSYAPKGAGAATLLPLAKEFGLDDQVIEITNRISYYHTLVTLQQADALLVPGSDDPQYTASKIYPYLLLQKPLLALFHQGSSVVNVINDCTSGAELFTFHEHADLPAEAVYPVLENWANGSFQSVTLLKTFSQYGAERLAAKQVELFKEALNYFEKTHTNA